MSGLQLNAETIAPQNRSLEPKLTPVKVKLSLKSPMFMLSYLLSHIQSTAKYIFILAVGQWAPYLGIGMHKNTESTKYQKGIEKPMPMYIVGVAFHLYKRMHMYCTRMTPPAAALSTF